MEKYKRTSIGVLPFETGCIGYVSYNMGKAKDVQYKSTKDCVDLPHLYFQFYDVILSYNHQKEEWLISWDDLFENSKEKVLALKRVLEEGQEMRTPILD
ncbi:hypothetical protein [endosymbiont 'TC1' of Trimyema compressum]|uniref:hypothetical protein n=1 Tax=endosymbiont 'TC1' of Trimyema compressum TaxID=243899 RepID=UPI000B4C4AD0|nr:hypothetical protein [endosymbiont 'TC1' of Trimyema compressum]